MNTVLYWHKSRHTDKWNRESRNKPKCLLQLIYDKGGKNIQWRKGSVFNKWCCKSGTVKCKSMKLKQSFIPYTKINSKYLIENMITIQLLEDNISKTFSDIYYRNIF